MQRFGDSLLFIVVIWLMMTPALAGEIKVGDQAPDFELRGSDGELHRLKDYRGKVVVLAWFPKAFTGG